MLAQLHLLQLQVGVLYLHIQSLMEQQLEPFTNSKAQALEQLLELRVSVMTERWRFIREFSMMRLITLGRFLEQ